MSVGTTKVLKEVLQEDGQMNAHAEQRQVRIPIPTNMEGNVIGLKTKWHNIIVTVRSIARIKIS